MVWSLLERNFEKTGVLYFFIFCLVISILSCHVCLPFRPTRKFSGLMSRNSIPRSWKAWRRSNWEIIEEQNRKKWTTSTSRRVREEEKDEANCGVWCRETEGHARERPEDEPTERGGERGKRGYRHRKKEKNKNKNKQDGRERKMTTCLAETAQRPCSGNDRRQFN